MDTGKRMVLLKTCWKKRDNMKVFLMSHVADLDGVMPVVLTDLAFSDYDYQLLDIAEVDPFIEEKLASDFFHSYDKVFLTDLGVSKEVAEKIENSPLKEKLQILDHHQSNLFLNEYSFGKVVVSKDGILQSGTSLYYQYLLMHHANTLLARDSVSYMVSLVRLLDTWEWKKYQVIDALDLGTILAYYGNEKFIQNYVSFLRNHLEFSFTETEKILLETDKNKKQEYFNVKKESLIKREIAGYQVGIVFAEQYISELGNTLAEELKEEIDLIMIIRMDHSLSFRSVKEDVDVSKFARLFSGNGHVHAAGAPLPSHIHEKVIDFILEGMIQSEN